MMHSYLANPLEFLVTTLFSLYILAVMLRFLLGVVRADFYNPVSQFLVRVTNPLLAPLRKLLPGLGRIDIAAIVLMFLLQLISVLIVMMLRGVSVPPLFLVWYAVGRLVMMLLNVYLFAIIVQAVVSWVNPGTYNPINSLLYSLTAPLLKPIQRILPPMSGIDLSPLFAIIGLQVLRMLIMPLLG
jgi:YggT family protein